MEACNSEGAPAEGTIWAPVNTPAAALCCWQDKRARWVLLGIHDPGSVLHYCSEFRVLKKYVIWCACVWAPVTDAMEECQDMIHILDSAAGPRLGARFQTEEMKGSDQASPIVGPDGLVGTKWCRTTVEGYQRVWEDKVPRHTRLVREHGTDHMQEFNYYYAHKGYVEAGFQCKWGIVPMDWWPNFFPTLQTSHSLGPIDTTDFRASMRGGQMVINHHFVAVPAEAAALLYAW